MTDEPRARATRGRVDLRKTCACGKDGTDYAHGPFDCAEVRALRARVDAVPLGERLLEALARFRRGGAR